MYEKREEFMNGTPNSIRKFVNKVETILGRGNVDLALCSVRDCVEKIITEPLCVAQAFGSYDLDKLCMKIGRQNLCLASALQAPQVSFPVDKPLVVYIVSRLQSSGGHTRLVQDFIKAQPQKNHLILSTEVGGPSDKNYLNQTVKKEQNTLFLCAPRGNLSSKLTWLQSTLLAVKPVQVGLLNHHQDSVAIAAIVPELQLRGSFYHHGDHHLCLGVFIEHLSHIDLHPVGYHICRDDLGIDNYYLPLTCEDKPRSSIKTDFMQGGALTTATVARSNKVEIPYHVSYLELVPELLKATGGQHIHIGKLTWWGVQRMRAQMRKHGLPQSRLVYIEWTPNVSKLLQELRVDLYLSSFPYGAGLTLIEVMGAGIPVVMHRHMYSPVLSALELAYPQAFSWSHPDELLKYLKNLKLEDLEWQKIYARQRYEAFHRPSVLRDSLAVPSLIQVPPPSQIAKYKVQHDEWAMWAESQLSFFRLVHRFVYRTLRKLRNAFSLC